MLGVKVNPYVSAVVRSTLIAAVARIMQPGCKVDTVLMLEGDQGKRKSSAFETLFGKAWFTDDLAELGTKDASMQMAGVWGIEIADLAGMKKADVDKVKAFITRKVDRFRPPYGKLPIEAPRASIMVGTTNLDDWSKDETGGRRFWPVLCEADIDIRGIASARDDLWAEAVHLYRTGTPWWLTDKEVIETAKGEVAQRSAGDPWDDAVYEFVRSLTSVTVAEVLTDAIHLERGRQGRGEQMRVSAILKRMGWSKQRDKNRGDGKPRGSTYLAPSDTN
jgi:predicted P-loop ATPase